MTSRKPIIELSNSGMGKLISCPRKFQITKQLLHPVSDYDTSLPAIGGTAIHEYIQEMYDTGDHDSALMKFFYAWDFEVANRDSDWNKNVRDFEACLFSAIYAAREVGVDTNSLARFDVQGEQIPGTEVKFNIILKNPSFHHDYHYRGAIDLVLYKHYEKRFTVVDIKTLVRDPSMSLRYKYQYDTQTVPYGMVISQLTGQSVLEFQADYMVIKISISDPAVEQIPFQRTEKDVANWLDFMRREIDQIESYHAREVWPRTTTGCDSWNKPCKFFNECHIESLEDLQESLLFGREPKAPKPFGEWVTMEIDI